MILTWLPIPRSWGLQAAGQPALWHGIARGLSLPAHTRTERHHQGCYRLPETKTMKTHVVSHSVAIFTPTAYESPMSTLSLERDLPGTGRALAAGVLGSQIGACRASGLGPGGLPNSQLRLQAKHSSEFRCLPHHVCAVWRWACWITSLSPISSSPKSGCPEDELIPGTVRDSLAVVTAVAATDSNNTLIITGSSCPHLITYGQPQPTSEGTDADRPSDAEIQGCGRRPLPSGMRFTSGRFEKPSPQQTGDPCLTPQPQEQLLFTLLPGFWHFTSASVCLFSLKKTPSTSEPPRSVLRKSSKCYRWICYVLKLQVSYLERQ